MPAGPRHVCAKARHVPDRPSPAAPSHTDAGTTAACRRCTGTLSGASLLLAARPQTPSKRHGLALNKRMNVRGAYRGCITLQQEYAHVIAARCPGQKPQYLFAAHPPAPQGARKHAYRTAAGRPPGAAAGRRGQAPRAARVSGGRTGVLDSAAAQGAHAGERGGGGGLRWLAGGGLAIRMWMRFTAPCCDHTSVQLHLFFLSRPTHPSFTSSTPLAPCASSWPAR